jgi:bleomycin hydrolase
MGNKVSLVHDPRNPYDSLYTVSRLGNVVGGDDILYVNVPIDVLKKYTKDELTAGRAVWFGCEVGKEFCRKVRAGGRVGWGGVGWGGGGSCCDGVGG